MNNPPIDFQDEHLFGEADARYENRDLLLSYIYKREATNLLMNTKKPFVVLKAPKGSGKTALLILADDLLKKSGDNLSILKFDSEIAPSTSEPDLSQWVRQWKKNILQAIGRELAKEYFYAGNADSISLVEDAEIDGLKPRNLVGFLMDRIKVKLANFETKDAKPLDTQEAVKRKLSNEDRHVWVWIDEVDSQFSGSERDIHKVAGMLLAARELSGCIPNLLIRTTIKPSVFGMLETRVAAISNFRDDHVFDLTWTAHELGMVLAFRIRAHMSRRDVLSELLADKSFKDDEALRDWFLLQVFEPKGFDLGQGSRPPHEILALLTSRRPRWLVELCKMTAKMRGKSKERIKFDDIQNALWKYGQNRIKDFAAEYYHQCTQIAAIISRFEGSSGKFTDFHNLIDFINKEVLSALKISIVGLPETVRAIEIAQLLYQIDFISAKPINDKKHVHYDERPDLLTVAPPSRGNIYEWVIQPGFRQVLSIPVKKRKA
ncbi:MAG: hypothetical protein JNJ83_04290 [Verrucomicrobiaceae bacterium]|nr:hypothetical protein [Verrucomicrobiaceae bacterium]